MFRFHQITGIQPPFVFVPDKPPASDKQSALRMLEQSQDWKISKQFTLDVANAMPAELYNFKPNSDEITFGEQPVHIAGGNVFRFHQITGIQPPFVFVPAKPPGSDKQAALRMLEQSFDYVIEVLPQITPEQLGRTWHLPTWKGRTDSDGRAILRRNSTEISRTSSSAGIRGNRRVDFGTGRPCWFPDLAGTDSE